MAETKSPEFFMAACLLVVLGDGLAAAASRLSMALGAFVAGLLLAETEYRREIEVTIEPFKGLLLGLYFVSVGAEINPALIVARPGLILGLAAALIALKGLILIGLARGFRLPARVGVEMAMLLGPGRGIRLRDDRGGARRRPRRPVARDDARQRGRDLDAHDPRASPGSAGASARRPARKAAARPRRPRRKATSGG